MATPFLFVVKACSLSCCADAPTWWVALDYIFLVISFFAIYWSTLTTTKNWIKPALWSSWIILLLTLINEQVQYVSISKPFIYIPTFALVALHLYNLKYCQCKSTECCTTQLQ